jgi:integrase
MSRPKKQQLKQRKDGRYKCSFDGIQFYGATSDEALAAREEYKRKKAAGEWVRQKQTVSAYADIWLPLHKGNVSAKCYNDYAKQLEALLPVIGDKRLDAVTVDDAAAVWSHYSGYSASTIKRARMLYVALFDSAIENDLCRKNPFRAKYSQPPKAPSGSHRALTAEETALIQSTTHRVQLAALIMLYAGLRRGEVLALTRDDIDLTNNVIRVSKSVRFDGNRPLIVRPKTAAGTRTVPILSVIRPMLEKAPDRPLKAVKGDIMTDTAFKRAWDSYLLALSAAAGHPVSIRPHDLRHTYCTMLRDAGVDMHQAMLWMGHADEKMILQIYDHVTDSRTQNMIEKLETSLIKVQSEVQNEKQSAKT